MKKLINIFIDIESYFSNNGGRRNRRREGESENSKSLLIEYTFKYFDFCLILFLRENKIDLIKNWMNSKNKLFKFYCDYNILYIDKKYKENDFKEKLSLIGYFTEVINCFDNKFEEKIIKNTFKMKINQFNQYKIKENEDNSYIIKFNKNDEYNKLAIFFLDNNKNFILNEIIDVKDIKRKNIDTYIVKANKDLYFVPLKNVTTCLYSFDFKNIIRNDRAMFTIRRKIIYDNFKKIDDIPKYSWNLGYKGNEYLILSEDKNQLYSFIPSTGKIKFNLNKNLNTEKFGKDDKIIDLVSGSSKKSSFLLSQNGKVFCIEGNKKLYRWLSEEEKKSLEFPLTITINPDIKIITMSVSNRNSYAIDNNGNLYGNEDLNLNLFGNIISNNNRKQWINIPLPENNKRFLDCAAGENHLICLIEDNKGYGKIYAKGLNNTFQCGILDRNNFEYITKLTLCTGTESLDFKIIKANKNASAAVTKEGQLYIWGEIYIGNNIDLEFKKPELIKAKSSIFVDYISLNNEKFFAICKTLNNDNYIQKIFYLEYDEIGMLSGIENEALYLSEIKSLKMNNNNSKITPLKICIGINQAYVLCVEDNNLIKEIENNIKEENNFDYEIEIISENNKDNAIKKINEFYSSNNLKKFKNLLSNFADTNISKFIEIFDEIRKNKRKNNENDLSENIYYNQFIDYLKGKTDMNDLLLFFNKNEENEAKAMFSYLKNKISLIENNLLKYIKANIGSKSKDFLQKIILNNILYLTENVRIEYFNNLLANNIGRICIINGEQYEAYRRIKRKAININRHKAKAFYDKFNESSEKLPDIELNETIFGQLFHYLEKIDGQFFLLKKTDKLFSVHLEGEEAIDAGGPYHEIISNMCDELQSDYLDLFIKTPNNKHNLGQLRDKYMINPNSNRNIHQKAYEFIGKLMVLALSSGEALNLNLHPIIWKKILEKEISFDEYEAIDHIFVNNTIKQLEKGLKTKNQDLIDSFDLNFVIKNSNETDIELKKNGKEIKVNLDNLEEYIKLAKSKRINEFETQIECIKKGIYSGIDKNILLILNWKQLEEMVCGKNKLDINDLKKHTEYHGYNANDEIIKWFWEWLENSNEETQFKYLKFVSGRTRLPQSGFGFEYIHIISKISNENQLPKSATCFFTLKLPNYNSKDIFIEKIKCAIESSDLSQQ